MANRGTFACELEPGDVILSGQTFKLNSLGSFSPDEITLQQDYEVLRMPTDGLAWLGQERVEIVARPRRQRIGLVSLSAHRGRVVRTA